LGTLPPGWLLASVQRLHCTSSTALLGFPHFRPHPHLLLFGSPCFSSLHQPDNRPIYLHLSPPLGILLGHPWALHPLNLMYYIPWKQWETHSITVSHLRQPESPAKLAWKPQCFTIL